LSVDSTTINNMYSESAKSRYVKRTTKISSIIDSNGIAPGNVSDQKLLEDNYKYLSINIENKSTNNKHNRYIAHL
jgi:hypothetical protein